VTAYGPRTGQVVLRQQVLLSDLESGLSKDLVKEIQRKIVPLLEVVPDLPTGRTLEIARALVEYRGEEGDDYSDLDDGHTADFLLPYERLGASAAVLDLVVQVRVNGLAGSSHIADDDVVYVDEFRAQHVGYREYEYAWDFPLTQKDVSILRPFARTLPIRVALSPGDLEACRPTGGSSDFRTDTGDELDALAEVIAMRIEPTIGGHEFLAPDRRGRALAVLVTTVAAAVTSPFLRRKDHKSRPAVRADLYGRVLDALDLGSAREVARRVLEIHHPAHIAVQAMWPAGASTAEIRSAAILGVHAGYLRTEPEVASWIEAAGS